MIIAEIGGSHLGDMALAKRMILSAKTNGAGLVKSQLYNAEDDKGKPNYDLIKKAELTFEQAKDLFDYGESIGIEVFFSVFGVQYVDWCERIGVKRYKLACEYREAEVVEAIAQTGKPVIISTRGDKRLPGSVNQPIWLYCIPDYPATIQDMPIFHDTDDWPYYNGFSDHTVGIDAAKIAIARGASIIEKHFILDRNSPAPDAPWSMTPGELAELVRWERVCKEAL